MIHTMQILLTKTNIIKISNLTELKDDTKINSSEEDHKHKRKRKNNN